MMKIIKLFIILTGLLLVLSSSFCSASPEAIIAKNANDLNSRWNWAIETAQSRSMTGEFWIGYSIELWMGENSHISHRDSHDRENIPLENLLDKSIRYEMDHAIEYDKPANLENREDPQVLKELAILFRCKIISKGKLEFSDVALTDLDSPFNLKHLPLIWLELVDRHESAKHLEKLFDNDKQSNIKKDLIAALGVHQDCEIAFEKLKNIINSNESNKFRKDAVFWLSQQQQKNVLEFLKKVARNDKSESVREQAVFAISLIKTDEAVDELIDLARNAENREVRKKGIFWLGQMASQKASDALENVVYHDEETEIQKQAVFALSQLPHKQGLEKLMKVAQTHPNPETRKQAIFWIGQTGDESAVEFLVKIIKGE